MHRDIRANEPRSHWLDRLRQRVLETFDRWARDHSDDRFGPTGVLIDSDDDDVLEVAVKLPDLSLQNLELDVEPRRVFIKGKRKSGDSAPTTIQRPIPVPNTLSRVIPLPCEVDPDGAEATYKSGVLRLKLPKTERARSRRLRIPVTGRPPSKKESSK